MVDVLTSSIEECCLKISYSFFHFPDISSVFLSIFIILFMSLSSAPFITADATHIFNTFLEMNISFGQFFQIIWLNSSFGFCVVSKHWDKKLLSRNLKILAQVDL